MGNFGLLDKEEENDVEVQWEDQQKINRFSRLNVLVDQLEEHYKKQKTEKEYLEDLAMEIELHDEDEPVMYRVGQGFMLLEVEDAQQRIEKQKEGIDNKVEELKTQIEETEKEMAKLKAALYNKFGKAINLEKD
ncbi:hypothetical protein H4219_001005 [Mycoemilia scoparia]|uniref:Prefoldin subunit 4 n=1 Tax=Mycoemilia scoparia TaxID=417184 RepID=A0A9W8A1N7_9FUNG|nr:hypothetical protein H4219_001005 [Mycoemilia scoparia]